MSNPHKLTHPVLYGWKVKAAAQEMAAELGPGHSCEVYECAKNGTPIRWGVFQEGVGFLIVYWGDTGFITDV